MAGSLVRVPSEYRLGPAMQALNERQRKFVVAMLEYPSIDHSKAAVIAGYGTAGTDYAKTQGWRLAHDEKVQAAILEESKRRINAGIAMAVSRLLEIADDDATSTKDRLKALDMLLNRGGIPERTVQEHKVEHVTSEETLQRIESLAKRLGLEPQKLLGSIGAKIVDGNIIDAEYTEVNDGETDEFAYVPSN